MITSINPGAYLKFKFTGTRLGLYYTGYSVVASRWPHISYSIDGGAFSTIQLASYDNGCKVLRIGMADVLHTAIIYHNSSDHENRWNATMSLKITAIGLDNGATLAAVTPESGRMIAFGDSVTEGGWSLSAPNDEYSMYQSARQSWVQIVADNLNCELGSCALGGQSFASAGIVPSLLDAWDFYYGSNSRLVGGLLDPAPDWILCNTGENGADATSVTDWLTAVRAAAPSAKIALIIPFSQDNVAAITSGFNTYQGTPDTNCKLIDLGVIEYETTDGIHPTVAGHATLAGLVTTAVNTAFGL